MTLEKQVDHALNPLKIIHFEDSDVSRYSHLETIKTMLNCSTLCDHHILPICVWIFVNRQVILLWRFYLSTFIPSNMINANRLINRVHAVAWNGFFWEPLPLYWCLCQNKLQIQRGLRWACCGWDRSFIAIHSFWFNIWYSTFSPRE